MEIMDITLNLPIIRYSFSLPLSLVGEREGEAGTAIWHYINGI
jgi:hypothetical protein